MSTNLNPNVGDEPRPNFVTTVIARLVRSEFETYGWTFVLVITGAGSALAWMAVAASVPPGSAVAAFLKQYSNWFGWAIIISTTPYQMRAASTLVDRTAELWKFLSEKRKEDAAKGQAPRTLLFVLALTVSAKYRESVVGDATERFANESLKFGRRRARILLFWEIMESILPALSSLGRKAFKIGFFAYVFERLYSWIVSK